MINKQETCNNPPNQNMTVSQHHTEINRSKNVSHDDTASRITFTTSTSNDKFTSPSCLQREISSVSQPPNMYQPQQFRSISHKFGISTDLRNNLIADYSKSTNSRGSVGLKKSHEKSEIIEENISQSVSFEKPKNHSAKDVKITETQKINKKVFYKLVVFEDSAAVGETMKTYEDFKELHEKIRVSAKNSEELIDLPNKGSLGLFASDKKIEEFRVFALQVYLKALLTHANFKDNRFLQTFLGVP